ncbi:MAG: hemolysin family protein, partial [Pirellulaceae bacterium]
AAGMDDDEDGEEEWLEDEIRSMVSGGEREGLLESGERDMIEGVMELDEKDVFSVMTPRSKVDALDCEIDNKTAVEFVVSSGRTRIPIFRERLDNIVGILYAKDLLRESLKEDSNRKKLVDIVRPALTVPESIVLNEMLQRFLREQIHMAIVVDEYGAFSGIVTIEDILEEIVGEIVDETDRESHVPVVTMVNGVAQINGSARVDEVNEELGTEIPEDDEFDTVAGWIMARTKQVPRPGTNLVADDLQIRILRGTRRVIDQIELRVASKDANPNESGIAKS